MKTYNQFVNLVREWANRDSEVLSDAIVTDCMDYAIDKAYRILRIQPLESTVVYSSAELNDATFSSSGRTITELAVPSDLIEFIQIRAVDTNNATKRVFNEKTDIRTFYDPYAEKYTTIAYWTRIGNTIALSPGFKDTEDSMYLHYYRKLEALNERYEVTAENANLDPTYVVEIVPPATAPTDAKTGVTVAVNSLKKAIYTADVDGSIVDIVYYETTVDNADIPAAETGITRTINTASYYGELKPNWFRDDNQRILINGALSQIFIYLNEPDTAQMYQQLFINEIRELNDDEVRKKASGGNIQINVNANGLI